ncbi:metal ABC transporter permease [uncultured Thermosynechococcus sp.]|uniref:metal ABC transporter permease n=1 Tax=uncultured Thermosynechococcus sp. TaxID=436945 RepID=UPI002629EF43|nr:metal ABC transporter permease [uncultured Thermosynechococcus sp.]
MMITWLLEPLQHAFMVKALGVSTLVGCVCAVLSCFLTLKGWALMGDAVSHAVLPGVVLAYWLGLPFALGAFLFGLMAVTLIGFIQQQTRVKEDTVIGLVFTGFFALGLVLLSKTASSVDLMHILFGNVLGISDRDLWQTVIVSLVTLITIVLRHRDFILFCFDPTHARTIGLNTTLLYYLLLALLSLTTVAALQTVGIILVVGMLITPGATAYLLSDRFGVMVLIALGVGGLGSLLGTYISYYLDASTGGCIVVLQTVIFLLVMIFAPKHGLLAKARSPLS